MDSNTHKLKILIVDDETELAGLFGTRLQAEGYEVQQCDNGETALATARSYKPDLILLDLMMPRLSGFDAIELFRNTLETSASKIIVLSALSQPADMEKTKSLGADGYIVKSDNTIGEVVAQVKAVLEASEEDTGLPV